MIIVNVFYNGKSLDDLDPFSRMIIQNHAKAIIEFIKSYEGEFDDVVNIRYEGDFSKLKKSILFKNDSDGISKEIITALIKNGFGDYLPPK